VIDRAKGMHPTNPRARPTDLCVCAPTLTPRPWSKLRLDRANALGLSQLTLHDSVIFVVRSAILKKSQSFFNFSQSFCYIIATVLSHYCYGADMFFNEQPCLAIFATVLIHATMLNHFSELSHSSCYNAQPF
jgi:hypothetical protein